jgi:pantothenate synthetase
VLQKILYLAKEAYDKYPRTYEEDMKELERTDLTFNQRNCLLYTSGEKVILNFLIKSC